MKGKERTRANLVEALLPGLADAWTGLPPAPARSRSTLGYSPIIGVDADKIVTDLPGGHVLNVIRQPVVRLRRHQERPCAGAVPLHHGLGASTSRRR